jgi:hypothetical protein
MREKRSSQAAGSTAPSRSATSPPATRAIAAVRAFLARDRQRRRAFERELRGRGRIP